MKKFIKSLNFWYKSALYYLTPGGYGYYRNLRKLRNSSYDPENDKSPVTLKHTKNEGWEKQQDQGGIQYRDYDSYDEYLTHQKNKFDGIIKDRGFSNSQVLWFRLLFYRRFRYLEAYLPESANIVCAGARQGTEVEVLQDLGFKNAYGIDLNPGPDNKFVRVGDFMHLDNKDSSLDMIYCNALDHALNLKDFFTEHARVIKQNGYALYDISLKMSGSFEAAEWENAETVLILMLQYFKKVIKVEIDDDYKWVLLQGKKVPSQNIEPA